MPQFDKITFFNQLFWLFIFFSGFYLTLLKIFLPKLSSILKVRNKKLQKGSTNLAAFSEEQTFVTFIFHNLIETISSISKNLILNSSEKITTWICTSLKKLNEENLKKSNFLMEKLLHKQITTTFLFLNF
jgi:hypothetical protein